MNCSLVDGNIDLADRGGVVDLRQRLAELGRHLVPLERQADRSSDRGRGDGARTAERHESGARPRRRGTSPSRQGALAISPAVRDSESSAETQPSPIRFLSMIMQSTEGEFGVRRDQRTCLHVSVRVVIVLYLCGLRS